MSVDKVKAKIIFSHSFLSCDCKKLSGSRALVLSSIISPLLPAAYSIHFSQYPMMLSSAIKSVSYDIHR